MMQIDTRWIIRSDMDEVFAIEHDSFPCPWTEDEFRCCLMQRNVIGVVAELNYKIVGFVIYELHKSALRILNLAVATDVRRQCVGRQMVQRLIDKLAQQRRREVVLDVTDANTTAHMFFAACGFRASVVSSSVYQMRYSIDDHPQRVTGTVLWSEARRDKVVYDVAVRLSDGTEAVVESPVIRRMGEKVAVWT